MSTRHVLTLAFVGRVLASKRVDHSARALRLIHQGRTAVGTPAVVYDVPGLRTSMHDGPTGPVCPRSTPWALAQAILSLHAQPLLYARLREQAWVSVKELSWDRTARAAWAAVESCL